ncbi:fcf2 [Candida pseudojiufengensis]|uniref:fcf2 n=1 Tax=Candida pseudojiufengensis TaxID=497109 RepID=UPI0022240DD0|nr:fcf2 [Candida pseudojiufengensis]KAI5959142.1 fcf2 [Candida pseudojiufengensis]
MGRSLHKQQEPTIAESSETESHTSSDKLSSKNPNDNKSLDELFKDLNEELNKTNTKISSSKDSPNNILDSNEDFTSINYDFKNLEKKINNLPKIQSNLESSSSSSSNPKTKRKSTSIRIHDPVMTAKSKTKSTKPDAGSKWFNISQPELTPTIKRDLQIIKQRTALDPKRHYKKEKWDIPKFFQMGTIIESSYDSSTNKLQRKQRGENLVKEILNDDNTKKYFKRKYNEIQISKTSGKKNHYKKVKNDRKKF